MRLIDADALIAQIRANIVQAAATERGATDPNYIVWLNAMLHLMTEEVEEAPEVDPVHAAGGVYCRECECFDEYTRKNIFDGECMRTDKPRFANDFCSRGVKRGAEEDG